MSLNNLFIDLKVFAVLFWEFVSFIHFLLGCCSYGFLGILYILAFFFKKKGVLRIRVIQTVVVCVLIQAAKVWSNPGLGIGDIVVKR